MVSGTAILCLKMNLPKADVYIIPDGTPQNPHMNSPGYIEPWSEALRESPSGSFHVKDLHLCFYHVWGIGCFQWFVYSMVSLLYDDDEELSPV